MHSAFRALTLSAVFAAVSLLTPSRAEANSSGNFGGNCNSCHSGGTMPTVTLSPTSAQVLPGATVPVTITVSTPNGSTAGFSLTVTAGTLSNAGPGVKISGSSATHTTPKTENGQGNAVFTVDWTAPTSGSATFTAWGNSVNGNNNTAGDRGASVTTTASVCSTQYFLDADMDGVGGSMTTVACAPPPGYVTTGGDCNDANATIKPGAPETCNGVDDDCDLQVDDGAGSLWYADADADGYGNPNASVQGCVQPTGRVADNTDCNDTQPAVHPGAAEVCNFADDDCDTQVDEGLATSTFYADSDMDGFGNPAAPSAACMQPAGHVVDDSDCDDQLATTFPGATEVCNFADDDCDGAADDGIPTQTWFLDADMDGVGGSMTELACKAPKGYVAISGDCDETNGMVKPGAPELCNMLDEDCDGNVDEGVKTTFYRDADGDLFGNLNDSTQACSLPTGYVANEMDCDDTDGSINPNGAETCDAVDEDCDGTADDGVPMATCGVGACAATGASCHAASCSPGISNPETCNGIDDDCNGSVDDDPDALCSGPEVCIMGACALPEDGGSSSEDAGTNTDAGTSGVDAGTGTDENPQGCGCTSTSGTALAMIAAVALLLASGRRRRRA